MIPSASIDGDLDLRLSFFFSFWPEPFGAFASMACALAKTSDADAFLKVFVPTSLLMGLGPRERPALLEGRFGGAFFAGRLGASSKRVRLAEAAEVVAAAHVEVVGVALIVAAAAQAAQHLVLAEV